MSGLAARARGRAGRGYRRATSPLRTLPAFVVIGAQRAGSSSLFAHLTSHPDVAAPTHKELHFFDQNWFRGLGWYRRHFPLGRGRVAGEASPYYLFHPSAPERLAQALPEARLLVLLRDPVARSYSHYQLSRRNGHEPLSFEEAIEAEPERLAGEEERIARDPRYQSFAHRHQSYVARGRYLEQLERWHRFFPRGQLLALRSEDLFADPAAVYAQVLAFLGLAPYALPEYPHLNRAGYDGMAPATRERLAERFREPNARLYAYLGRDLGWEAALRPAEAEASP